MLSGDVRRMLLSTVEQVPFSRRCVVAVEPAAHSVSVRWVTSDSVVWRDRTEKSKTGLAAVGECALPGGFRITVFTRPVGVIDGAVFVVAGVRATETLVVRGECVECSLFGCVFDGGHVFADSVAVDVVRARAGHQFVGYVVDGDCVLVGCGLVVALVGDVDESGGISKKNCSACARFCAVSSASWGADCFVFMEFRGCP